MMSPDNKVLFTQYRNECVKARERIQTTPNGKIGWVINFIQTDLEALTPSEWTVLAFEVAQFIDETATDHGGMIVTETGWAVECIPDARPMQTVPSRMEARELQQTLLNRLEDLWHRGYTDFSIPKLRLVVTLPGLHEEKSGSILIAAQRKLKEFEYRFAHLLATYSGRVRRCQECRKIYLATRYDQLFCDSRCQTRVATRKWRETHKPKKKRSVHSTPPENHAQAKRNEMKGDSDGKAKR